jgi:hypothetical protein
MYYRIHCSGGCAKPPPPKKKITSFCSFHCSVREKSDLKRNQSLCNRRGTRRGATCWRAAQWTWWRSPASSTSSSPGGPGASPSSWQRSLSRTPHHLLRPWCLEAGSLFALKPMEKSGPLPSFQAAITLKLTEPPTRDRHHPQEIFFCPEVLAVKKGAYILWQKDVKQGPQLTFSGPRNVAPDDTNVSGILCDQIAERSSASYHDWIGS